MTAFCILYLILIAYLAYKVVQKIRTGDEACQEDIADTSVLADQVKLLNEKMLELEAVDNMIIDIRLCVPGEYARSFRVEWLSDSGNNKSVDFLTDGSNVSSDYLLEMALSKRNELNQEIQKLIEILYCSMQNCVQNNDFQGEGSTWR